MEVSCRMMTTEKAPTSRNHLSVIITNTSSSHNTNNHHSKIIAKDFYDFMEETDSDSTKAETNFSKRMRRKRKNKNCRGQFRHETMELYKLGTNNSTTLCKSIPPAIVKPVPPLPSLPQIEISPITNLETHLKLLHRLHSKKLTSEAQPSRPEKNINPTPRFPPKSPYSFAVPPPQQAYPAQLAELYRGAPTPYLQRAKEADQKRNNVTESTPIDLSRSESPHKCHCECGKTLPPPPPPPPTTESVVVERCPVIVSNKANKTLFSIEDIIGPNSVIKSRAEEERRRLATPPPVRASSDHSVAALLSPRRGSCDLDAASVSSAGSNYDSSPVIEALVPHGKLVYFPEENILLRYNVDAQKRIFNMATNGTEGGDVRGNGEVVKLPANVRFNSRDNLSLEDYVTEMEFAERIVPKDFFHFYKFVTGYQICNNNLPVSFLTFLKIYNTNGLANLLERYVKSLGKNGK